MININIYNIFYNKLCTIFYTKIIHFKMSKFIIGLNNQINNNRVQNLYLKLKVINFLDSPVKIFLFLYRIPKFNNKFMNK